MTRRGRPDEHDARPLPVALATTAKTVGIHVSTAQLPQGVQPNLWSQRLGAARGFARYLQTVDPTAGVPGVTSLRRRSRSAPYLWSQTDIGRSARCRTRDPSVPAGGGLRDLLWPPGPSRAFGSARALGLRRDDVDLAAEVLTIGEAKFARTRLVPLHPSAAAALRSYAFYRDRQRRRTQAGTFFVSNTGTALTYNSAHRTFTELTTALGLRSGPVRPRIHDLRHILSAYRLSQNDPGR